jgi:hypothetical protein
MLNSKVAPPMRTKIAATIVTLLLSAPTALAAEVYLDKLDKTLDDWWNTLDNVCRGEAGGSEASELACEQRSAVSNLIRKKGCRNIYPATKPNATSYWICKR